ncbi:MAG: peptidase M28 family protein, partial [Sphingomonadales bacterium]
MNNRYFALSLATLCLSTSAIAASDDASPSQNAMRDTLAYEITEGLTTEVGQRQGGTEAEQRGRDWAVAKLNALGFTNVREEKFEMPTWVRGEEKAWVISPFQNVMAAAALGNSGSTGAKPLEGEVIYFRTLDDLVAAPDARVAGKIVFVDHQMKRAQDGSGYGQFGRARFIGPNIAAKKGAAAILIRSIGTDSHRGPHTGNTNFEAGVKPIPAAAISNPDADNLTRQVMRAKTPVKVRLLLTPQNLGQQKSGNVIAEVPGSDPSLPP